MDLHDSVAAQYFRAFEYHGDIQFHDFVFASGTPAAGTIRVARFYLPCTDGSELWLSATTGVVAPESANSQMRHEFAVLGSSPSLASAELAAATLHFDLFVEELAREHTFPLGGRNPFIPFGYTHALVIQPTFGDHVVHLSTGHAHVLQVVPISAGELEIKKTSGVEALFDLWDNTRKDISRIDVGI